MGPDSGIAEDVAELWVAATIDENGSPYHEIYAYSTLPKEQCWVYGRTGFFHRRTAGGPGENPSDAQ